MTTENRIFDTPHDTQRIYLSMKTKFVLRKDAKSRDGKAPIYLHASAGGSRERINTAIRVKPEDWIADNEMARPDTPELQDINLMLDNIKAKLTNIKTVYRLAENVLNATKLKWELANDMPRVNFVSFMARALEEDKSELKKGTYNRYAAVLSKLKEYQEEIPFKDITEGFFKKYRAHLRKKGNAKTTINSNIKAIKKYLKLAVKMGIKIPVDLEDIVAGSTSGNRTCLHPEEVKLLLNKYYHEELEARKHLALGYFLFACMTGLRISDVQKLNRNSFIGNEAAFVTVKTERGQIITLNNSARKIVQRLQNLFVEHIERNTINRWVQDIADELGIQKHISFHVGRHTFATNFLRSGGKIHNLMKLMGHRKIETTMIYVHILEAEANEEIYNLDSLF